MIRLIRYQRLAVLAALVLTAFTGLGGWLFHRQIQQHGRFVEEAGGTSRTSGCLRRGAGGIADPGQPAGDERAGEDRVRRPGWWRLPRAVAATLAPCWTCRSRGAAASGAAAAGPRRERLEHGDHHRYVVLKHKVPLEAVFRTITQRWRTCSSASRRRAAFARAHSLRTIRKRVFALDDYQRQYPARARRARARFVASARARRTRARCLRTTVCRVEGRSTAVETACMAGRPPMARCRRSGQTVVLDAGCQRAVHRRDRAGPGGGEAPAPGHDGDGPAPATGELLAMASWPTFDPGRPGTNHAAIRNRAISDIFEPARLQAVTMPRRSSTG